jgi:phenylpyruvate tautomerase PptA (4-oxalocrotonate tautomerase family)
LVKEENQIKSFAKEVTKLVSNLLGKVPYTTLFLLIKFWCVGGEKSLNLSLFMINAKKNM